MRIPELMSRIEDTAVAHRGALKIAALYVLFATLWILLSDQALLLFFDDPVLILRASVAKGWLFVAITAVLLYYLVNRLMSGLAEAYRRETALQAERSRTLRLVETIWDNSADAVYAKDAEGRYTLANKKVAEYVGCPVAELIGQDDTALFSPDEAKALKDFEQRVRRDKKVVVIEEYVTTALGQRYFITTKGPIFDNAERVIGTFGIAHDVTELKKTEDELRAANASLDGQRMLLQLFMQHAPAALAMLDQNLTHLLASRRWLEVYGVSEADMTGTHHYEIFPEIPAHWREVHRRALAGESIRSNGERFVRLDGHVQWVRWEVRPWHLADGGIGGIVIFSEDITAQHEAEEQVHALNAHLEQRVIERTAELDAANSELDAFAYAVSHDLRAPLRAMDGFARALEEDYGDRLDGEARMYLDQISIASRKMSELIEGILTLSRCTRGTLQRATIDVSALAERLFSELRRLQPDHRVVTAVEPGLTVRGDPQMVEVLLTNLIDNAWKYSGKTESPIISIRATEVAGRPGICIEDNGTGFDMAYAERLFKPFQRLHRQSEFPGTGIGLATVQRIAHRHGGEIIAEGRPGEGARFCFTLAVSEGCGETDQGEQ